MIFVCVVLQTSKHITFFCVQPSLRTAIIIDDEKDCRDSLAQTLELSNITVVGLGADGEEAFQLYEKHEPDVVILDLNMPNYDGNYAIEKIKEKYPTSRIVIVTAYVDSTFDRDKVEGVICKPYDVQALIGLIQKICSPLNPDLKMWYVG